MSSARFAIIFISDSLLKQNQNIWGLRGKDSRYCKRLSGYLYSKFRTLPLSTPPHASIRCLTPLLWWCQTSTLIIVSADQRIFPSKQTVSNFVSPRRCGKFKKQRESSRLVSPQTHTSANPVKLQLGHNTDGFDCSTQDLTIQNRWVNSRWDDPPLSDLTEFYVDFSIIHNQVRPRGRHSIFSLIVVPGWLPCYQPRL